MFGFLKKWLHASSAPTPPPEGAMAPGTGIRYHSDLVGRLQGDHEDLLRIFGRIQSAFDQKDYAGVSQRLGEFRSALQSHLLTENLLLYVYLEHCLAADEVNAELIRGFRQEMDRIGRAAMRFIKKYEEIGVDKDIAASFAAEIAQVGQILGDRIQREETILYPLYLPRY